MLVVDDTIVSDDVVDCSFSCNIACCKGACCVEGDSGAPLDDDEVPLLQDILPQVLPYMSPKGVEAVNRQGVAVCDKDGDIGTPLVDGKECAFVTFDNNGVALCAIQQAYLDGVVSFPKPVSCHLYPIRVQNYGKFRAVNYHQWNVCRPAKFACRQCLSADKCSLSSNIPLYIYLKEPLIRKFGKQWYDNLLSEIALRH